MLYRIIYSLLIPFRENLYTIKHRETMQNINELQQHTKTPTANPMFVCVKNRISAFKYISFKKLAHTVV